MASIEILIPLFAQNWLQETNHTEPVLRIESLLAAHGNALADPFMGWLFRLYVHLAHSSVPQLLVLARVARDANLAFWEAEIRRLEVDGHLIATDRSQTVAIILGAIERRTILARLGFGEYDNNPPHFLDVAAHSALALFQVYGTPQFWAGRADEPVQGWVAADHDACVPYTPIGVSPDALMELPSGRLSQFARGLLAQETDRLDTIGRKRRIQLAAMLECIEYGYEAATMARVANRAGVSTATLYLEYHDKPALFLDAIILQSKFQVNYLGLRRQGDSAAQFIVSMVYSLAQVLADPGFLWFHRISMASEISGAPELVASTRRTRSHTEGFWYDYFEGLVTGGDIISCDLPLTLNLLLGATQRRSVLSMIFFGPDDVSDEEIERLSKASTDFVLRLVGKPTN